MQMNFEKILKIIAVFLIINMFFLSGIGKFINFNSELGRLNKKLPNYGISNNIFIILAGLLEIVAPIIILYCLIKKIYFNNLSNIENNLNTLSIIGLIIFTVLATFIFYYSFTGMKWYPFISNTVTIGALILLLLI